MASGANGFKQTNGYFVPLARCDNKVLEYTGGNGAGGDYKPGSFQLASWASTNPLVSSINGLGAGGLLKDMGKTVVSSNRTFRKVQLIGPGVNTGGVNGVATPVACPYLTAYIELSTGQSGVASGSGVGAAPVAYLPGLM